MSHIKVIFAVLVLAVIVGVVPQAHAVYVPVNMWIAGSSAMWQVTALGAYNGGHNVETLSPSTETCHWTSSSNFLLNDTRGGLINVQDNAAAWVVWSIPSAGGGAIADCAANSAPGGPNAYTDLWVYEKVDSVVGVRCYFATTLAGVAGCLVQAPANPPPGPANTIGTNLWGDSSSDTNLPPILQGVLFTGHVENVGATDIRPEDANFASCRANSPLGNGGWGAASDGLDGLGYSSPGAFQTAGDCYIFGTGNNTISGVGQKIVSGYPGVNTTTDVSNVVAFAISSTTPLPKDPISGGKVPAFTVTAVGAAPIVFLINRTSPGPLVNLETASERQLQAAFSGTICDASAFNTGNPGAHSFSGGINIFLREPMSGTYNTAEATVFRYPTTYPSAVEGQSQETNVGTNNPLMGQTGTCVAAGNPSGKGARYRAIGTGEEVKSVLNSNTTSEFNCTTCAPAGKNLNPNGIAQNGIGYAFFSYGNVSTLATPKVTQAVAVNYGYIKLDGVDPIFASYRPSIQIDPGQAILNTLSPGIAGQLPGTDQLPAGCAGGAKSFPCAESVIWGNGFSFPNLRNGTYRSWSLLRLIATGTTSTAVGVLVKASNKYVVNTVPDYVPAATVAGTTDIGIKLLRSHYQQEDGSNPPKKLGKACTNLPENGGDMGGMIIPTTIGVVTYKQCQMVQSSDPDGDLSPDLRKIN